MEKLACKPIQSGILKIVDNYVDNYVDNLWITFLTLSK